jgi:sporulation protein YlmC with PRC-barrel domain
VTQETQSASGAGGKRAGRLIAASQLEHMPVFDAQGHHLGRIAALMLNRSSGQAVYAVLSISEPGESERLVPLPWSKLTYDAASSRYSVDLDERTRKAAPTYGAAETPWTDPQYDRDLSDYYNTPWYE